MRLRIPLTGTLREDGSGDPDDPVRVIGVDLGDIGWKALSFDFENGFVEVEADIPKRQRHRLSDGRILLSHEISEAELQSIAESAEETEKQYQERSALLLNNAKAILDGDIDALYIATGSAKLKNLKAKGLMQ